MRRGIACVLLALAGALPSHAAASPRACSHRVLVLSAMPLELDPLVAKARLDRSRTARVADRTFYPGRLAGRDVVLAMTGIGLVNAQQTAEAAFAHYRCGFRAAVFSGVAGSRLDIGDVAVPRRWTRDGGATWTSADPKLLAVASRVRVALTQDVPVGDAACLCPGVDAPTPVHLGRDPKLVVGGDGHSSDTYGGKALPCVPGGGDIAGCSPCLLPSASPQDAAAFAQHAPSLLDPAFAQDFLQPPAPTSSADSEDQETAAVAQVAQARHVPFLGIRAVSDGAGDPLALPGFPSQFVVYRQLAGDNAALVTLALLRALRR